VSPQAIHPVLPPSPNSADKAVRRAGLSVLLSLRRVGGQPGGLINAVASEVLREPVECCECDLETRSSPAFSPFPPSPTFCGVRQTCLTRAG
jgi:hypothetical protein